MSTFRSYVSVKSDSSLEDLDFNFEHSDEEIESLTASDNNLFNSNFYYDEKEKSKSDFEFLKTENDNNLEKKSSGSEVEDGEEEMNGNNFDSLGSKEIIDEDFEKKSDSFKSEDDGKVEEDEKQRHESLVSEERLNVIDQIKKLWEERKYLRWKNSFLHKKSRDFLKKNKFVNYFEKSIIFSTIHSDHR